MPPELTPHGLALAGYEGAVEVGWGGFAVVFRAWQATFSREVAIKVLTVRPGADVTAAFRRECAAIGSLSGHPNIVTVHDAGQTPDGRPFIVMEYLHGGSLGDRVRARGPLPWPDAVEMGVQLAGALETAHAAGLLHRDVKPENVLVSRFGQPKLGDFGIARLLDSPTVASGSMVGSLRHAAPEVLDGRPPTVASDVYSLGSTLFTVLAGQPPYGLGTDEGLEELRARVAGEGVPDLRSRGVPDAICRVVEQALAKAPAGRQAGAADVGRQLQAALAALGAPVPDLPVDPAPARTPPPRPRSRRAMAAVLAAVVVLVGGTLAVMTRGSGGDKPAAAPSAAAPTVPTTLVSTIPPPSPGTFTDDFSLPHKPWFLSRDPTGRIVIDYADGGYRMAIVNPPGPTSVAPSYVPITGAPSHSVRMEVDVTKLSADRADFGVICGGTSSQFPYAGLIDAGGWWRVVRMQDGRPYTDLRSGRDEAAIAGPGPHRLVLTCAGDGDTISIALSVDGSQLATATGPRGPSFGPGPGLLLLSLVGTVDVLFDNLVLTYS